MFHFLTMNEVIENFDKIKNYIKKKRISKNEVKKYLGLYSTKTINKILNSGLIYEFE